LDTLHIIALTHRNLELDEIGNFHIEDTLVKSHLTKIKKELQLSEIMYLSTCNRVEIIFTTKQEISINFLTKLFSCFKNDLNTEEINRIINLAEIYESKKAVEHIFKVAASLDSLVIGEREIITQVRKSFETCNKLNLTGDVIRLLIQRTINFAKRIYTESNIAKNPVSVVSLAFRRLLSFNINENSKFIIVGAGKTNKSMLKFLYKHGYNNFTIYNRSLQNAENLIKELGLNSKAKQLNKLADNKDNFDVILTCTSSANKIITQNIYNKILKGDTKKKIVIDLAIPGDFDTNILNNNNVELIDIESLKKTAKKNIQIREKELDICSTILEEQIEEFISIDKERKLERALHKLPITMKNITSKAYDEVFAKDLENLDSKSREVLDNFVSYLEKKYIGVPMKLSKEILL